MLMCKLSFALHVMTVSCDHARQITCLHKNSKFTASLCPRSIRTAVMLSVLLFDPAAKVHRDLFLISAALSEASVSRAGDIEGGITFWGIRWGHVEPQIIF